jgi:hypothetical protein
MDKFIKKRSIEDTRVKDANVKINLSKQPKVIRKYIENYLSFKTSLDIISLHSPLYLIPESLILLLCREIVKIIFDDELPYEFRKFRYQITRLEGFMDLSMNIEENVNRSFFSI